MSMSHCLPQEKSSSCNLKEKKNKRRGKLPSLNAPEASWLRSVASRWWHGNKRIISFLHSLLLLFISLQGLFFFLISFLPQSVKTQDIVTGTQLHTHTHTHNHTLVLCVEKEWKTWRWRVGYIHFSAPPFATLFFFFFSFSYYSILFIISNWLWSGLCRIVCWWSLRTQPFPPSPLLLLLLYSLVRLGFQRQSPQLD